MVRKRTLITWWWLLVLQFYCYGLVSKSRPTYFDSMNCSTSGFPVLHHLLEIAQTHVHSDGDAIQPSHPLWPPSPPTFNLSMRVFSSESALHIRWRNIGASASASVLPVSIHCWFPLGSTGLMLQRMRRLDSITDSMDTNLSKLRDSEAQASLVRCSPWGRKKSDMT